MGLWSRFLDAVRHSARRLGQEGEEAVAQQVSRVRRYRGKLLRNVYVPRPDGTTTELDLVYLTRKGVFVLESKNYSGYIFGRASSRNWTASLYAGRTWLGRTKVETHPFYNPIWQNRAHITHLRRYLPPETPVFSVIVFSDRCTLKELDFDPRETVICHVRELPRRLRRLWWRKRTVLTKQEVASLYQELLPLASADRSTRRRHVRETRTRTRRPPVCPLCGGALVMRTARSGDHAGEPFYGCSNYPRCRYLREME